MTGDRTRTDSAAEQVGIREADEPKAIAVAIDRLRELATEAADLCAIVEATGEISWLTERDLPHLPKEDRAFIAALSPTVFLSLITAYESQAKRLREVEGALEPFATVGRLIDGPFGPRGATPGDGTFSSGAAWTVNGEKRTLTWGDFRKTAALTQSPPATEKTDA